MWAMAVFVLLAGVAVCGGVVYSTHQDEESEGNYTQDIYEGYDEDNAESTELTRPNAQTRVKRFGGKDGMRTLNSEEIHDVQGALDKMFNGNLPESLSPRVIREYTDIYDYAVKTRVGLAYSLSSTPQIEDHNIVRKYSPDPGPSESDDARYWKSAVDPRWSPTVEDQDWQPTIEIQRWSPVNDVRHWSSTIDLDWTPAEVELEATSSAFPPESSTFDNPEVQAAVRDMVPIDDPHSAYPKRPSPGPEKLRLSPIDDDQNWNPLEDTEETSILPETSTYNNEDMQAEVRKLIPDQDGTDVDPTGSEEASTIAIENWTPSAYIEYIAESSTYNAEEIRKNVQGMMYPDETTVAVQNWMGWEYPERVQKFSPIDDNANVLRQETTSSSEATTMDSNATDTPTTASRATKKSPRMDINAIIAIIANLTYDYEWNLTEEFNKTLIDHGVPTCPTASTITTTSTTPSPYDFSNTSVVGKCFVCGLKTPEIPRDANCADAFAGDFLPLGPVDARSRSQIASYRKYCRHLDVHNFVENPSEPRSIYGRFTGGCGVRWTDLTGIYTQRTCRARFRPLMGMHFASKRMAKLELSLINVDNGCIISPMASLLPMSRGVSLYARFHACVCTGSWCNPAPAHPVALPSALAMLAVQAAWPARPA